MVENLIRLFDPGETNFSSNGIGVLSDAISCIVTEEKNGSFELELQYPIYGKFYNELAAFRRLIVCKPNQFDNPQAFRIYEISKPINGIVTVNAQHISYDLSGYIVRPFTSLNIGDVWNKLTANMINGNSCPFKFTSEGSLKSGKIEMTTPMTARALLGGEEGSILENFGGEYKFDNYQVTLMNHRGSDRGVTLYYGKNLTDLNQEENNSNVYTEVYPYYYTEENGLVDLPERVVKTAGTYNYTRTLAIDVTSNYSETPPTADQLRADAKKYIEDNELGVPKVSIDVSFLQLAQSEEYESYAPLEDVRLCDEVSVIFKDLGVVAKSKCITTVYNVLTGKYDSISLGESRATLASTIVDQDAFTKEELKKSETNMKDILQKAIDRATELITGNSGGYVVIHDSDGDTYPDEILVMDQPDYNKAKNLWRWNKQGFGHSNNGYNGPFDTAITMEGAIVADYITAGKLAAGIIKTGRITDANSKNYWDLDQSILYVGGSSFQISGKTPEGYVSDNVTQKQVLDMLTNHGQDDGFYLQDGKLYLHFSAARGHTLILGGSGNTYGELEIRNSSDHVVGTWDNTGIDAEGNIRSNGGGGYSELNGGTITCTDGSSELQLFNGKINVFYDAGGSAGRKNVGIIGAQATYTDINKYGLSFDLDSSCDYMTFAYEEYEGAPFFNMKLSYTSRSLEGYSANRVSLGCPLDMNGFTIYNANFPEATANGICNFIRITEMNPDGTAKSWVTDNNMVFKDGMLVGGNFG